MLGYLFLLAVIGLVAYFFLKKTPVVHVESKGKSVLVTGAVFRTINNAQHNHHAC
jgi:hypothetical protein